MKGRSRIRIAARLLLLLVAGAAVAVALQRLHKPQQEVPTTRVRRGDFNSKVYTTGELRAGRSAMLMAPAVGGSLRIIHLTPTSTPVKAGDMVVEFDPSEQEFSLEQNRSELAQAEEEIAKAKADAAVQAAQDQVDLLKANFDVRRAELEVSRNELVSAIDAKKNLLSLEEAKRRLAQLEQDIKSHSTSNQASIAVAQEKREKARIAIRQAEENIANMRLRASLNGIVVVKENREASGGFYFTGMRLPEYREGDEVGPGAFVAEVLDVEQMEIQAKVDETDRAALNAGQPVEVRLDALPGKLFPGRLKDVAGMATRNFWGGAQASNKFDAVIKLDRREPQVRPGLTAQAVITGDEVKAVLCLPRQALFEKDGNPVVYVRNGAKFEARKVKVTHRSESQVAVEGVTEGTEVALVNPEEEGRKPAKGLSPAGPMVRGGGS
jgi:HlyD family secretion protein